MGIIVRRSTSNEAAPVVIQSREQNERVTLEQCEEITYAIRRFRQAKRMSLKVAHDGRVWVSLPMRGSMRDAREFVRNHLDHIRTALEHLSERRAERQSARQNSPLRLPHDGVWYDVYANYGERFHLCNDAATATMFITIPHLASAQQQSHAPAQQQPRHKSPERTERAIRANHGTNNDAAGTLHLFSDDDVDANADASSGASSSTTDAANTTHATHAANTTHTTHAAHELETRAFQYWRYTMIARANAELPARTIELARSVGEPINRVSIRDQRTLWGSCSAGRRSISLNWRSVLFPPFVRDYLILHELAHLKHQNHSDRYWQWVEQLCPNYREAEAWIAANGRAVMDITYNDSRKA
jgi:predicted metal-dependent hydrolase